MPPARRPRPARPQTARCRYAERGERCRRIATVADEFCRQHAFVLEAELEARDPIASILDLFGASDHPLAERLRGDPFAAAVAGTVGGMLGQLFRQRVPPGAVPGAPPPPPPRARAAPRPPPEAPPDPRAQELRAREILGFEPDAPLTAALIKDRKRALAKLFHPDTGTGSKARMQSVLAAADLLLTAVQ